MAEVATQSQVAETVMHEERVPDDARSTHSGHTFFSQGQSTVRSAGLPQNMRGGPPSIAGADLDNFPLALPFEDSPMPRYADSGIETSTSTAIVDHASRIISGSDGRASALNHAFGNGASVQQRIANDLRDANAATLDVRKATLGDIFEKGQDLAARPPDLLTPSKYAHTPLPVHYGDSLGDVFSLTRPANQAEVEAVHPTQAQSRIKYGLGMPQYGPDVPTEVDSDRRAGLLSSFQESASQPGGPISLTGPQPDLDFVYERPYEVLPRPKPIFTNRARGFKKQMKGMPHEIPDHMRVNYMQLLREQKANIPDGYLETDEQVDAAAEALGYHPGDGLYKISDYGQADGPNEMLAPIPPSLQSEPLQGWDSAPDPWLPSRQR